MTTMPQSFLPPVPTFSLESLVAARQWAAAQKSNGKRAAQEKNKKHSGAEKPDIVRKPEP